VCNPIQGGGTLDDASTPGTPAGYIAASAHGGTYNHVAAAGWSVGRGEGCRCEMQNKFAPPEIGGGPVAGGGLI